MSYDSAFGQMMSNVFGGFDLAVFSFFGSIQNDVFTFLAKLFTGFGETLFVFLVCLMCCVLCLFKRSRKIGVLVLMVAACFVLFNDLILKNAFVRLRPYNALQGNSIFFSWYMNAGAIPETPYCFPSGHSCWSFAAATALFLWIRNDKKNKAAWAIFIIPIFVIMARVYLMVHYPSDVIFGSIEGITIAIVCWYIMKLAIKLSPKLPEKIRNINKIDLTPFVENKIGRKINPNKSITIIVICVLCFLAISCVCLNIEISKSHKCEHKGTDYICMNEGKYKVWDDSINDFRYYCDIHDDEK